MLQLVVFQLLTSFVSLPAESAEFAVYPALQLHFGAGKMHQVADLAAFLVSLSSFFPIDLAVLLAEPTPMKLVQPDLVASAANFTPWPALVAEHVIVNLLQPTGPSWQLHLADSSWQLHLADLKYAALLGNFFCCGLVHDKYHICF